MLLPRLCPVFIRHLLVHDLDPDRQPSQRSLQGQKDFSDRFAARKIGMDPDHLTWITAGGKLLRILCFYRSSRSARRGRCG